MNAPTPERKPVTEEISSLIERVTFHSDESGFCVLRVKTRGQREDVTVVGSLPSVTAGEWLVAEGWWVRDKEHGLQFKAVMMKTVPPPTTEGIERYLGSGLVKGIGPVLAKKMVERFGAEVLAVIDHVLLEATSDGHCALPRQKLRLAAVKLLEAQESSVEQALSQMLTSGFLLLEEIDGEPLAFLPHLRRARSLEPEEPRYSDPMSESVRCRCRAASTPIAVTKSGAEGGRSAQCLRNRLRGNNRGASDGQKTSRRNPAVSLGAALVNDFLRRG
jgi:hypothetical protein